MVFTSPLRGAPRTVADTSGTASTAAEAANAQALADGKPLLCNLSLPVTTLLQLLQHKQQLPSSNDQLIMLWWQPLSAKATAGNFRHIQKLTLL